MLLPRGMEYSRSCSRGNQTIHPTHDMLAMLFFVDGVQTHVGTGAGDPRPGQ